MHHDPNIQMKIIMQPLMQFIQLHFFIILHIMENYIFHKKSGKMYKKKGLPVSTQ